MVVKISGISSSRIIGSYLTLTWARYASFLRLVMHKRREELLNNGQEKEYGMDTDGGDGSSLPLPPSQRSHRSKEVFDSLRLPDGV